MQVLVFDPGENTGWVCGTFEKGKLVEVIGGTSIRNHVDIGEIINRIEPDIVVYETFNMYPWMKDQLQWNSFYPCEVIGVIGFCCACRHITVKKQAPSVKKFSGGLDETWKVLRKNNPETSEHMKDAYLHLKYFMRNNKDLLTQLESN